MVRLQCVTSSIHERKMHVVCETNRYWDSSSCTILIPSPGSRRFMLEKLYIPVLYTVTCPFRTLCYCRHAIASWGNHHDPRIASCMLICIYLGGALILLILDPRRLPGTSSLFQAHSCSICSYSHTSNTASTVRTCWISFYFNGMLAWDPLVSISVARG